MSAQDRPNSEQSLRALVLELSELFGTDFRGGIWARRLKDIEKSSRDDDVALANRVLSNYGTMGAVNDWSFSGLNAAERNKRYNFLIAEIAELGAPLVTNDLVKQNAVSRGEMARTIEASYE